MSPAAHDNPDSKIQIIPCIPNNLRTYMTQEHRHCPMVKEHMLFLFTCVCRQYAAKIAVYQYHVSCSKNTRDRKKQKKKKSTIILTFTLQKYIPK